MRCCHLHSCGHPVSAGSDVCRETDAWRAHKLPSVKGLIHVMAAPLASLLIFAAARAADRLHGVHPAPAPARGAALQASLAVGDEVCTTSGLYGTGRRALDDSSAPWRSAPGSPCASTDGAIGIKVRRHRPSAPEQTPAPEQGRVEDADTWQSTRTTASPLKVLAALAAITLGLYGLLFAATTWGTRSGRPSSASTSRAAPSWCSSRVLVGNNKVSSEQLNQARDIIVQRVDANGVAGAEVTTRGGRNIVVSMPGHADQGHRGRHPQVLADALPPRHRRRCRDAPSPTADDHARPARRPASPPALRRRAAAGARGDRRHDHRAKSGLPRRCSGATTAPTPSCHQRRATTQPAPRPPRAPTTGSTAAQAGERQRPGVDHPEVTAAVPGARLRQAGVPSTRSSTTPPSRWSPATTTAPRSTSSARSRCAVTRSRTPSPATSRCPTASRRAPSRSSCPSTAAAPRPSATSPSAWSASRSPRNRFAVDPGLQGAHRADRPGARSSTARPASPAASPSERPRPGQPAEVRRPAAVVHAADP